MTRVIVIAPFPPSPDGVANYTYMAVLHLEARYPSIRITVLATDSTSGPPVENLGPRLKVVRIGARGFGSLGLLARLAYHLVRERPQVIHLESGIRKEFGGLFGEGLVVLMLLLRTLRFRFIVTMHSTWWREDVERLARTKQLSRWVTRLFTAYYLLVYRLFFSLCAMISIATVGSPTPAFRREMERYCRTYAVDPSKVVFESHPCQLPSTITTGTYRGSHDNQEPRLIVGLGFIREDKGFHMVLEAADRVLAEFPDTRVIIAGYPPRRIDKLYAERLVSLRRSLRHGDRVVLDFRLLSEREFEDYLDSAHIVVLPYLQVIAPSGPLHRALGRGKIVVASGTGHNLALGDVAVLVPPGDADALAERLLEVLRDPSLARALRERALSFAAKHSWDALADQYYRMYQTVLTGKRAAFGAAANLLQGHPRYGDGREPE